MRGNSSVCEGERCYKECNESRLRETRREVSHAPGFRYSRFLVNSAEVNSRSSNLSYRKTHPTDRKMDEVFILRESSSILIHIRINSLFRIFERERDDSGITMEVSQRWDQRQQGESLRPS